MLSYSKGLVGELRGSGVSVTALCPGPVDTGFGERAGFSKGDAEATLPSFMWESAEAVAKCGVDGLARGHWVAIRPGESGGGGVRPDRTEAPAGTDPCPSAPRPEIVRTEPGSLPRRAPMNGGDVYPLSPQALATVPRTRAMWSLIRQSAAQPPRCQRHVIATAQGNKLRIPPVTHPDSQN